MKKIKFWFNNTRYNSLPQSMLPAIVALVFAVSSDTFSIGYGLMAILGVALAHLSMNLFDDYFDYRIKGNTIRENLAQGGMRVRISKCDYLKSGEATMKQLFGVASLLSVLALILGVLIFLKRGLPILYITAIAGILGVSYSAPPLKLSYHGMGELTIAALFGPLLMSGVYYASCGMLSSSIWFISIPIGLLIANIVYSHDIMDYEHDKIANKRTLAVLLSNRTSQMVVSALFMLIPFCLIIIGTIFNYISCWYLITLIIFPLAITLYYLLWMFIKYPERNYKPLWWMQPMERWEQIEQAGIDWFMIRWYLSRNLVTFFCLILVVLSLIL